MNPTMNPCAVTMIRYWGAESSDLHKLYRSIEQSLRDTTAVIIAINVDADKTAALSKIPQTFPQDNSLHLLPLSPWGCVTHSLNLLLNHARQHFPSVPLALFRSCELSVSPCVVRTLHAALQQYPHALVAGAALSGHLDPFVGSRCSERSVDLPITGRTVPWNTLALWRLCYLHITGFPLTSSLVSPPGLEEVAVLALHHRLFASPRPRALLVAFSSTDAYGGAGADAASTSSERLDLEWDCRFQNSQRSERHHLKMASKCDRANQILQLLHVSADDVKVTIMKK